MTARGDDWAVESFLGNSQNSHRENHCQMFRSKWWWKSQDSDDSWKSFRFSTANFVYKILFIFREDTKVSHYIINKIQQNDQVVFRIGDQSFSDMPELLGFYKLHYLDTTPLRRPAMKKQEKVICKFDFEGSGVSVESFCVMKTKVADFIYRFILGPGRFAFQEGRDSVHNKQRWWVLMLILLKINSLMFMQILQRINGGLHAIH